MRSLLDSTLVCRLLKWLNNEKKKKKKSVFVILGVEMGLLEPDPEKESFSFKNVSQSSGNKKGKSKSIFSLFLSFLK